MSETCHSEHGKRKADYLLWGSLTIVASAYAVHALMEEQLRDIAYLPVFTDAVYDLMNIMWWGLALGILFVGLLSKVPREFVMSVIGRAGSGTGLLRATLAGIMLDLCSHGVLLVGMKLYERGASMGQVVAFLVASPWNSLSLTVILVALVGWKWTLFFILGSAVVAVSSGLLFDMLTRRGVLPANPNNTNLPGDFQFWREAKARLGRTAFNASLFREMTVNGLTESRMILRWIFFGVVLASLIRTFVSPDQFETLFGPTLAGLGLTVLVATILEVCSEGSTPIAADILNRANAPGNAFAFLMTGVSTDYTEIMSIRETTQSWKISLFLPLITVPQVLALAWMVNVLTLP